MMQAAAEIVFDTVYLVTVLILGFIMIGRANGNRQFRLFGIMAVILGLGDAFHLIPRAYALCTDGLSANAAILGVGKLITSITMTVFYVILYKICLLRYELKHKEILTWSVYGLAAIRIILCLYPQNRWTDPEMPLSWGIYRNIPFVIIGLLVIALFYKETKERNDRAFRFLWLAVALSFVFYIPVVLLAGTVPLIGMLMIPKTCAYVWIVLTGFLDMRKERKQGLNENSIS